MSRHLWKAGALWGTYDIVRTISNVPSHLGQLIMTERPLSNVPGTFGRLGPYGGHSILSEHYQMSRPIDIIKCPFPLGLDTYCVHLIMTGHYQMSCNQYNFSWSLSNVLGQCQMSHGHYQLYPFLEDI